MTSWCMVTKAAKLSAVVLLASALTACIVAPVGHHPRAVVVSGPVVVDTPVVVAPAPPVVVVRPAVRRGYYPYHHRY
jgi:hypothetical protein